jgi:hypothetical protein
MKRHSEELTLGASAMTTHHYQICRACKIRYSQADFLSHRVAGYCTKEYWQFEP